MDFLKAEMAKKRKALDALKTTANADTVDGGNNNSSSSSAGTSGGGDGQETKKLKFIRQGDLIAAKEQEREDKQRQLDEQRARQAQQQREAEQQQHQQLARSSQETKAGGDSASSSSATGRSDADSSKQTTVTLSQQIEQLQALSAELIKQRLRALNQPICLFGEGRDEKIQRLAQLLVDKSSGSNAKSSMQRGSSAAATGGDDPDNIRSDDEDGGNNEGDEDNDEFREQDTSGNNNEDDNDSDNEDNNNASSSSSPRSSPDKYPRDQYGNIQFTKVQPPLSKEKLVLKYFKNLLKMWEMDLNQREDYSKLTAKGMLPPCELVWFCLMFTIYLFRWHRQSGDKEPEAM
jgi:hypothetical protein